jgi:hypothetical protein
MAECKIIHTAGPMGPPYYVDSPMVAYAQCETHGFAMGAGPHSGDLCPIGRVEKAVEQGLALIHAAAAVHQRMFDAETAAVLNLKRAHDQ